MISQCMNPKCGRDLHYLRDGRVVRSVQRKQERVMLEHFWLCGECLQNYQFSFAEDGRVSLARRHGPRPVEAEKPLVLNLVA
jgi:hypothetical protein